MVTDQNTIINLLGFKQEKYLGKNAYKSDEKHSITTINKIYLFINGVGDVDDEKPFATIDLTKQPNEICPIEKSFDDHPITQLSDFIIKFKLDDDPYNNTLYDFNNKPHELSFKIGALEGLKSTAV